MTMRIDPEVVIVGLCGHGLALVRSLARQRVRTLTLEQNPDLPGTSTGLTVIRYVDEINGDGLVDHLLALAAENGGPRPTLLLTNDRMVATIARHVDRVEPHYRLSWAGSAPDVLRLLSKDEIEAQCLRTGIAYPRSSTFQDLSQLDTALASLRYPVIFKPTQPVSAFKTIVTQNRQEVEGYRGLIAQCLPVIVQEFIPGDDRQIHFGALLLDQGRVVARFEGRKLRSRPMGHTTIAVSERNDEVHALTLRFFAGLGLSGPASLELKRDASGQFWAIEPTVGRTDFWIDVAVHNGVNLPLLEHWIQTGHKTEAVQQTSEAVWLNGERDTMGLLWLLRHERDELLKHKIKGVYLDWRDPKPFLVMCWRKLIGVPQRLMRKVFK